MYPYTEHPEIFDQILLLPDRSHEAAMKCLETFTSNYKLSEVRQILWDIQETCLTSEDAIFSDPSARADLILRCKHLQELVESAFIIVDQWNTPRSKSTDESNI
jgi:hypothetical protein